MNGPPSYFGNELLLFRGCVSSVSLTNSLGEVGYETRGVVIEQKINEFFGDAEATGFGTGWWSGILSAFFGFLSFGGVLCLHFPQLLSSPELRPHYPMQTMRVLIQCLIVGAILFGIISSITRKKKTLALTGMLLAIAATALGGSSVQINSDFAQWTGHWAGLVFA